MQQNVDHVVSEGTQAPEKKIQPKMKSIENIPSAKFILRYSEFSMFILCFKMFPKCAPIYCILNIVYNESI